MGDERTDVNTGGVRGEPRAGEGRSGEGRRLASLRRLGALDSPPDPVLEDLVELAASVLGADAAALTLVDAARAWTLAATTETGQVSLERRHSVADRAVRSGAPVALDVAEDPALAAHPWCRRERPVVRLAAAPVLAPDGERVGGLEVGWCREGQTRRDDPLLLDRLARQVSEVLELRAEVREYRRFVDLSPDAVAVLDLDGAVELANPAMARVLGLDDPGSLVGRPFLDLVTPQDRPRAAAELARVLVARPSTTSLDLRLRAVDGRALPVSVAAGHLRGSRRSLQLVVRDVSDRERAETERARLSEQLARAQRLEAIGQLAGGLAHDLNNLLAVLVGNLGLADENVQALRASGSDPAVLAALEEDLAQLRTASSRVDTLTRKLLQYARQEGDEPQLVDVGETVRTVVELLETSVGVDVRLAHEIGEDVPVVSIDPDAFEQALVNLVLNARDASQEGDEVRIVVRGSHTGETAAAEVMIEDRGVGMDETTLARAFEPLFTTKPKDQGTGLGLASVLGVVERAGGSVHLESAPGRGTRASLVLPSAVTVPPGPPAARTGPRVLLVDASERQRQLIARMLEAADHQVHQVATAEDALSVLGGQTTIDALIADLASLQHQGAEVLAALRSARPELPVVLLSSGGEAALAGTGVPVLTKPFSSDRLLRTVAGVCGGTPPG